MTITTAMQQCPQCKGWVMPEWMASHLTSRHCSRKIERTR